MSNYQIKQVKQGYQIISSNGVVGKYTYPTEFKAKVYLARLLGIMVTELEALE